VGENDGERPVQSRRGALSLLAGAPGAVWSKRISASLVDNLPAATAPPIVLAAAVMSVIALLAASVPARRAPRVQPMEALRRP
jgi:ABC-type lipoprotein release transport system permease subunit